MKSVLISLLLAIVIEATPFDHGGYAPEYAHHPSYSFSYGVKDQHSGDVKSQWETRDNGIIKGHYSVVEPDGSIREVDYTADAKNGFNAVVKTHGPNSHPIIDEHGHHKYVNKYSQSKINHYSKNQDTLILSSDVPQNEAPVAEINEKIRHAPGILELKPNVELTSGYSHHHTPTHETIYQPQKFNPGIEIHHPHSGQKYYAETHHEHKPTYKPGTVISVKHNPVQTVKKVKLVATSGLKNFATHHKIIARNDYQHYLNSRNEFLNQQRHRNNQNYLQNNVRNEENQNYYQNQNNRNDDRSYEDESEEEEQQQEQVPQRQNLYNRRPKSQILHRYAPNVQNYRAL